MPRVTRSRVIDAPPAEVWGLVSDPYSLPRWWPRASRVEDVAGQPGRDGTLWTLVIETSAGRGVRADYRCTEAVEGERYAWEQQLEGTPFERHLRAASFELELAANPAGSEVRLRAQQRLRGLSRLGSPLMRGGQGRILAQALEGIDRALGGDSGP